VAHLIVNEKSESLNSSDLSQEVKKALYSFTHLSISAASHGV
jgi:hypothetical protein